jgi:hypothetical protein
MRRGTSALLACILLRGVECAFSPELIKTDSECGSDKTDLGRQGTLAACAAACDRHTSCHFFNWGKLREAGRCFMEETNSSRCTEGWLGSETRDFYRLNRLSQVVMGCMDERADNYNAAATQDDGTCVSLGDPCVSRTAEGKCTNCVANGQCTSGNDGYRNSANDTVFASKVADGAIHVDGDLRDWATSRERHYQNVAFATLTGDIVTFESHDGGKWYGPDDFSISFMLAWDSRHLYLAAEVQDDVLTAGNNCFDTGLQAGFEVSGEGGPAGLGLLQAERSKDAGCAAAEGGCGVDYSQGILCSTTTCNHPCLLPADRLLPAHPCLPLLPPPPMRSVSKLQLLNLGLRPAQVSQSGVAACSSSLVDPLSCCVHYERSVQDGGFVEKTQVAVLRNPVTRVRAAHLLGSGARGVRSQRSPTMPACPRPHPSCLCVPR